MCRKKSKSEWGGSAVPHKRLDAWVHGQALLDVFSGLPGADPKGLVVAESWLSEAEVEAICKTLGYKIPLLFTFHLKL